MAKRKPPKGSDIPEWVVTYGDLMSLLLCFFILLVAFSEPKKPEEFQQVLQKIKEALGFRGGDGQLDVTFNSGATNAATMAEVINRGEDGKFAEESPQRNIVGVAPQVTVVEEGNLHSIGGALPFSAGSTDLSLDARAQLRDNVAPKVRDKNYIVRVVGHSWGPQDQTLGGHMLVSFERALAVRDFLVDECGVDPIVIRLEIAGDHQPSPEGNGTSATSNRRVQVYMTDKTVDQVHPDPFGTGRGKD
jgi:chemotaxis protein MotB